MTIAQPLLDFWYANHALTPLCRRTPWGVVIADERFRDVWDANHASDLESSPGITMEDIRAELWPPLDASSAAYEHVEFWDPEEAMPALQEMRSTAEHRDPDVVMVNDGMEPAPNPADLTVEEVLDPEQSFWAWYRETKNEFGNRLSDAVEDQMVRRDREVHRPAGMRWFVSTIDGRRAGFAALFSLAGVGYIESVVTMPRYRRRGVATATVARAARESFEAGDSLVHLLAEKGGSPQRLYERLGFRVVAEVESFTRPRPRSR